MPAPINISLWWNFGSLLGLCLRLQIISGVFLAIHFSGHVNLAFDNLIYICRDVNNGYLLRALHANGASIFFICIYLHIGRGIYYSSFTLKHTWIIGVTILLATIATAFLGYVLPWGQISLWGASVITNLLSTIPYIGQTLVKWLWGGFAVDTPTLTRFFALHFLLPFIIIAIVIIHITLLHQTGSSNPIGIRRNKFKTTFHPYYTLKDILGIMIIFFLLLYLSLSDPYKLGDPENFNPANPLNSPPHIQPEWYYLFAYAILRSVPNKLGGVVALVFSILILYTIPLTHNKNFKTNQFYPMRQTLLYVFISVTCLLTWIGAKPVEAPYIITGQALTALYFLFFITEPIIVLIWDKINTLRLQQDLLAQTL